MPSNSAPRAVGFVLTRPRERHLQHHRRDRRQDHHGERAEDVAAVAVASPPPPPPKIAPHIAMRAMKVMPIATAAATEVIRMSRLRDVRELVREHAAQLVFVDDLEQPLRHRDRRVVRVAAGRERVGLRGRADVDAGIGMPARDVRSRTMA